MVYRTLTLEFRARPKIRTNIGVVRAFRKQFAKSSEYSQNLPDLFFFFFFFFVLEIGDLSCSRFRYFKIVRAISLENGKIFHEILE